MSCLLGQFLGGKERKKWWVCSVGLFYMCRVCGSGGHGHGLCHPHHPNILAVEIMHSLCYAFLLPAWGTWPVLGSLSVCPGPHVPLHPCWSVAFSGFWCRHKHSCGKGFRGAGPPAAGTVISSLHSSRLPGELKDLSQRWAALFPGLNSHG